MKHDKDTCHNKSRFHSLVTRITRNVGNRDIRIITATAMVVAVQVSALADGMGRDTVSFNYNHDKTELLAEPEPSYTKEVMAGSPWSSNWFASVSAGTSAFVGSPLGCEDLFGRMQPAVQISVGKWFTPSIGFKVSYQGFGIKFVDANIEKQRYYTIHADLLWNIIRPSAKDELGLSRWTVAPYVGGGIIEHKGNGNIPFTLSYGIMAAYRLSRRLSVNMELAGLNTFKDFDGLGKRRRFGDQLYTLSAGLAVNIGKVGWRRTVDANPYRQQNEHLRDHINGLLQKSKIHSSDSPQIADRKGNGEYSGLASLRARLAGKDANRVGSSSLVGNENGAGRTSDVGNPDDTIAGQISDGQKLIGVPFYFFFRINTCELTDDSQLQNLSNLAKVAKSFQLHVYVDGAADAATGTEPVNDSLSESRARYIACLLHDMGVPDSTIHIRANGGIDKFSPVQRNRHTRVMIKSPSK